MQRSCDNNPATILVFWGSLGAMNDVTHLCLFDIPLISNIPNMVYLAPTCRGEYLTMLDWSIQQTEHPVAIRVPATVVSALRPAFFILYLESYISRLNEILRHDLTLSVSEPDNAAAKQGQELRSGQTVTPLHEQHHLYLFFAP